MCFKACKNKEFEYFKNSFKQHRFSINKVLVQENVYDDIYDRLDKRFQRLRCGSNLDKCNDYGAFINETEFNSLKNAFTSDNQLVHTKHYYQCSQDKSQKYISTPSIVTNIQINSDFYQSEVIIELYVGDKQAFFFNNLFKFLS